MKKYWEYFKYVMEHKRNVFLVCRKQKGMFWHGVFHDLSKFHPKEFKAYAWKFYGGEQASRALLKQTGMEKLCISKEDVEEEFQKAWTHHYTHNKHHWNYWIGRDMPEKFIRQMICDWKAMSRKFGDTAQAFYIKNYNKMDLTWQTRMDIEWELDINDSMIHNYGHTLQQFADMYGEYTYNRYFDFIKDKYGVDSYKLLRGYQQYKFMRDYKTETRFYPAGYVGWVAGGVVMDEDMNKWLFDLDGELGKNMGRVL